MSNNRKIVLVVDDEPGHRKMVRAVLEDAGWRVLEAESGDAALDVLSRETPHTALVDMRMPGMDGLTLLREIHARIPGLPVVLLTAYGSVGSAVEAMKKGAYDYLTKPADNEELKAVLEKCWEYSRLISENARLRKQAEQDGGDRSLVGATPGMHHVRELIEQAGPSEASVLVLGESGTGKELVAEGLHSASMRNGRPLIKVNCAALPADLLESELFGYVKGAFTGAVRDKPGRFQLANHGTLFLDEIGEMPAALQAKLLRALQEKTIEPLGGVEVVNVDVRIIAATNRDLQEEIREGRFREDLYYRLAVLEIRIPPLRERVADLPLLVSHLLRKLGKKNNKPVRTVSPAFLDALSGYNWPGNVRELENVLERALILSRSDELGTDLLPPQVCGNNAEAETGTEQTTPPVDASTALEDAERQAIIRALEQHGGHRERTADALGISRRTLQYKLKKYGLTRR
ncbi:DNA-binding transcriptional response regulator, NtrC family, contains REC, AAA-type ATPase, and a Fis-type DNA-binding domains [Paucidesulfovibrio gracilis DSM 16080]|uniref:DNA-binding transcriptional response regulator, NtrC family, contains REC, AAA-type ATPase, and a Fis-type DNA-binding domains n=1 Tax=Paucidesulfovibrio gracilis DSM 16080 TaxID=1121449 RepID=A0A1T4W514_9BACT|nr:sigma-54 dependent transcriptional regulator [Paucidesulfovibrio gracilis]SKA72414.1 DNA-binding transcriptional response regulator, NtrC family, contains REC, AAA-type ATPase, and a Fis-type DNA-binding domains [Paucidesulfovibrio gracilis DSM 16080]